MRRHTPQGPSLGFPWIHFPLHNPAQPLSRPLSLPPSLSPSLSPSCPACLPFHCSISHSHEGAESGTNSMLKRLTCSGGVLPHLSMNGADRSLRRYRVASLMGQSHDKQQKVTLVSASPSSHTHTQLRKPKQPEQQRHPCRHPRLTADEIKVISKRIFPPSLSLSKGNDSPGMCMECRLSLSIDNPLNN